MDTRSSWRSSFQACLALVAGGSLLLATGCDAVDALLGMAKTTAADAVQGAFGGITSGLLDSLLRLGGS